MDITAKTDRFKLDRVFEFLTANLRKLGVDVPDQHELMESAMSVCGVKAYMDDEAFVITKDGIVRAQLPKWMLVTDPEDRISFDQSVELIDLAPRIMVTVGR